MNGFPYAANLRVYEEFSLGSGAIQPAIEAWKNQNGGAIVHQIIVYPSSYEAIFNVPAAGDFTYQNFTNNLLIIYSF